MTKDRPEINKLLGIVKPPEEFKKPENPVSTKTQSQEVARISPKERKRRISEVRDRRPDTKRAKKFTRPTPYEASSFELSKLIQAQNATERDNEPDIPDEDPEQSLYMLLGEGMPTKVSKTMPLSKLFYYLRSLQMVKLLANLHKVLTTDLFESLFLEGKISVVHSRIEEIQKQGKWCLKQPKRFIDPYKKSTPTQWDNLLSEAVWMATDFREGKKYKIAMCYYLATAVMEYHAVGKEVCIKRKPIRHIDPEEVQKAEEAQKDAKMDVDETEGQFEEFISNDILGFDSLEEGNESPEPVENTQADEPPEGALRTIDESEVATMDPSLLVPPRHETEFPIKLMLLESQLSGLSKAVYDGMEPMTPFLETNSVPGSEYSNVPVVPISKLILPLENDRGWYKLVVKPKPEKQDKEDYVPHSTGLFPPAKSAIIPPAPPPLEYLELRTPTIWLPEDDEKLLDYAEQFAFNWHVVLVHLLARPTRGYTSNIERRTPWQCFERYLQLVERMPLLELKGPHAAAAQAWLEAAYKMQKATKRRLLPLGVGRESIQRGHTKLRWASMFEAMKKLMKKRESAPKPNASSLYKKQMSTEDKGKILTPADLLRMKADRERELQLQNARRTEASQNLSQDDKSVLPAPKPVVRPNSSGRQGTIHSQVSAIISLIQAKNPTWTNEEVTRAAARHITLLQNSFLGNGAKPEAKNGAQTQRGQVPANVQNKLSGRINLSGSLTPQQKNQIVLRLLQKQQQESKEGDENK